MEWALPHLSWDGSARQGAGGEVAPDLGKEGSHLQKQRATEARSQGKQR